MASTAQQDNTNSANLFKNPQTGITYNKWTGQVISSGSSSSSSSSSGSSGSSTTKAHDDPSYQFDRNTGLPNPKWVNYVAPKTTTTPTTPTPTPTTPTLKTISTSTTLRSGSSGTSVTALQNFLIANGYSVGSKGPDGKYGDDTTAAVKLYQKANGLTVDGIAGSTTLRKVNTGISTPSTVVKYTSTTPVTTTTTTTPTPSTTKPTSAQLTDIETRLFTLINNGTITRAQGSDQYNAYANNGTMPPALNSVTPTTTTPTTTPITPPKKPADDPSNQFNTDTGQPNPKWVNYVAPKTTITTITSRSSSEEIKALQQKLIAAGYSVGSTGADGKFGTETSAAIRKYQKDNNIPVNGNANIATITKLNSTTPTTPVTPTPTTPVTPVVPTTTPFNGSSSLLQFGSEGQAVKDLQNRLMALGYDIGATTADGKFGSKTEAAVKKFQTDNGFTGTNIDGKVGPQTNTALTTPKTNPTPVTTPTTPVTPVTPIPTTPTPPVVTTKPADDPSNEFNTDTGLPNPKYVAPVTPPPPVTATKPADDPSNQFNTDTGQPNPKWVNYVAPAKGTEDYNKVGDTQSSFYTAKERTAEGEQQNLGYQQGFSNIVGNAGIINKTFLTTIANDPSIMAFYINALTYGGYQMGDILNDMKRRELISQGGANVDALKNLTVIDPEQNRNTYTSSADGTKSISDTASLIPTFDFQGLLNPDILKYGSNMPEELFNILVPILDKESPEFKAAVAKVKATYFDLATSALQATTEQDKTIADYNLKQFKDQLNEKYGIILSDDATKAWNQIQGLENTFNTRGIAGSGLQNEEVDKTLKTTRLADQRQRDAKLTDEEINKANYLRASASSAEIASLTPEERVKYGFTPSAEILNKYSISSLRAQYPDKPNDEIHAIHDALIDENGNYRSTLYSNYFNQKATTAITNQTNAENQVIADSTKKEEKAYENYTASTAFLGQVDTGNTTEGNGLSNASNAAGAIKDNSTDTSSTPPVTPPPAGTSSATPPAAAPSTGVSTVRNADGTITSTTPEGTMVMSSDGRTIISSTMPKT